MSSLELQGWKSPILATDEVCISMTSVLLRAKHQNMALAAEGAQRGGGEGGGGGRKAQGWHLTIDMIIKLTCSLGPRHSWVHHNLDMYIATKVSKAQTAMFSWFDMV